MPANLVMDPAFASSPEEAFVEALLATNDQLHASAVDDAMSGTTAVAALVLGRVLHVANVGDSRAVLAERAPGGRAVAVPLSFDHTPFRRAPSAGRSRAACPLFTGCRVEVRLASYLLVAASSGRCRAGKTSACG